MSEALEVWKCISTVYDISDCSSELGIGSSEAAVKNLLSLSCSSGLLHSITDKCLKILRSISAVSIRALDFEGLESGSAIAPSLLEGLRSFSEVFAL